MGIEDLKRWHWIVLGGLLGGVLGYMNASLEPAETLRTVDQVRFERALREKPRQDNPIVKDLIIYPPRYSPATRKTVWLATFDWLQQTKNRGEYKYTSWAFLAEEPFKPTLNRSKTADSNLNIRDHVAALAQKPEYAHLSYNYAWWTEPRWIYAIWIGGTVLVVGGVWPTIINLLIGAGFGRKREKDPDYDLDRFKGEEAAKPIPATVLSETDQDKLAALEASLTASLQPSGAGSSEPGAAPSEPEIRKLAGGPAESTTSEKKEQKDYKGEFYPVVRKNEKK